MRPTLTIQNFIAPVPLSPTDPVTKVRDHMGLSANSHSTPETATAGAVRGKLVRRAMANRQGGSSLTLALRL
jgi:hypothetical protein